MPIQTSKVLNKFKSESKILSCDMAHVLVATKSYAIFVIFLSSNLARQSLYPSFWNSYSPFPEISPFFSPFFLLMALILDVFAKTIVDNSFPSNY
jgi:hypothetical protein